MEIRAASKLDVAAVVACANMAFATELEGADRAGPEFDAQLEAQILAGAITVFRRQGKVLGYISLCSTADHLFVDSLAVHPDCHGQGVGSLLLLFAEHEAARRGLGSVRLFTTETMAGNQGFYERRGYLETDRSNDDGLPVCSTVRMLRLSCRRAKLTSIPSQAGCAYGARRRTVHSQAD